VEKKKSVESKEVYKIGEEYGTEKQYRPVYSLELCGVFCLAEKKYFLRCLYWMYYLHVLLGNRTELSPSDMLRLSPVVLPVFVLTRKALGVCMSAVNMRVQQECSLQQQQQQQQQQ
jgi:hypothetical protein